MTIRKARYSGFGRNYRSMPDILVAAASALAGAVLGGERVPLEARSFGPDTHIRLHGLLLRLPPMNRQSWQGLARKIRQRAGDWTPSQ